MLASEGRLCSITNTGGQKYIQSRKWFDCHRAATECFAEFDLGPVAYRVKLREWPEGCIIPVRQVLVCSSPLKERLNGPQIQNSVFGASPHFRFTRCILRATEE